MQSSHICFLAFSVVSWTVVLQHVLNYVTSGPTCEHQLAVLVAHILWYKAVEAETYDKVKEQGIEMSELEIGGVQNIQLQILI